MFKTNLAIKKIKDQTPADKMFLLKLIATQILGEKWKYYRKIKTAGEGLQLLKKKSHLEQMKATRSALGFTSKNAKKAYRFAYQSCLKDIKSYADHPSEDLPELFENETGQDTPSLTSEHDAVIITWTPLKFFLPIKIIKEKGKATQRHTEGLIAKLYFKVVAYYATPENWDAEKLSLYLSKIEKDSTYQEVSAAFEPLKSDLFKFAESFELFRFGKASLSKESHQSEDTFDDAMSVESFDSQIRTVYWYNFIYEAMELFLFRYFLTLITATESQSAIQYLASIFGTAMKKAVENRILFIGSFETEPSKTEFREPFYEYVYNKRDDPLGKNLKTSKGVFQTYNYYPPLLEKTSIKFSLESSPEGKSEWGKFITKNILNLNPSKQLSAEKEVPDSPDENPQGDSEGREYALLQMMSVMIECVGFKKSAGSKIMDQFNKRVITEKEQIQKRIGILQKRADKKIRLTKNKIGKMKRMKQDENIQAFENDLKEFGKQIDNRAQTIRQNSFKELKTQKIRLDTLLNEMSRENSLNEGLSAKFIVQLIKKMDPTGEFSARFIQFVADDIQEKYQKTLEPFYQNMFEVLDPSTPEKMLLIQSLQKSAGGTTMNLSLSDEEKQQFEKTIRSLNYKIEQGMPGIFKGNLLFLSLLVPIKELFNMCIDNQSLQMLLRLKITTPKSRTPLNLPGAVIKLMLLLNKFMNPVPRVNLILEGREDEQDPQKAINNTLLNKHLANV